MSNTGEKLLSYWKAQQLMPARGLSLQDIQAFETQHKVQMPADLRDYFLQLNGLAHGWPNDQDKNGFSFWQLSRVQTVVEAKKRHRHLPVFTGMEDYFIFSDYLQWSWAYAIRLTSEASGENSVVIVGKEPLQTVARSFSEFVDLYLADSSQLYGA
ncbi:MAG TPA: SMI1/KNR4 family protein [Candidatus Acidoferrum sp.]|nr:SMI1/KNR4 family protein [Candidatus Acidoferrum sp.]